MAKQARKRLCATRWRELLALQARSGLSVSAFCAREGVSAASFYQWRSRLGASDRKSIALPAVVPTSPAGTSSAFVDLGTLGSGGRFELRLELGGGLVLQLARG